MNVEDYFEEKKQKNNKSFAFLIERCSRSEENPYSIKLCNLDFNRTSVVVLAGTAREAQMLRATNGLLKKLDNFIFNGLRVDKKEMQVCAAVCHFGKYFNPDLARRLLYLFYKDYQSYEGQMHNFEQTEAAEYIVPNYVVDLYKQLILPRLCDEKQNLLPFDIALQQMKKLVVIVYCHGAYTWMKLEEQINLFLMNGKYSNRQKKRLLKSITVLAYSPDCPLGYSQTQFISLASASDLTVHHGNGFIRYMHRGPFVTDFGLAYLPEKYGNVFYCAQYSKNGVEGNPRVLVGIDPSEWFSMLHQPKDETEKTCISEHGFLGFKKHPEASRAALKLQKIGAFILISALENAC